MQTKNKIIEQLKIIDQIVLNWSEAVVPIYGRRKGSENRIDGLGTAFLANVENRYYLVSAAHVFSELDPYEQIVVFIGSELASLDALIANKSNRGCDLLVIPITPCWMELAKVEFSKCIPHELPKTASTGVDLYLLLGYPGSKNNTKNALSKKLTRTLVSYTSAKFIASPRSKSQLTDRIALQFYKKGLINSQAVKENMGKFNGNSGGPMLEVRRLVEVQGEVRFTVRLVGVFSGYDKQTHELVGCSSNALLNFIRSNGGS